MSNCGKAFSEWAGIQGLTSQRLRPRRRKQSTAIQTEVLEDRVMLSAVLGSVDTQAVDLGGNLPTFSEFDASESGMATVDTSGHEEVVSSQKNDWTIIGNPSLETTVDTSGHEEVANSQKNGWIIAGNPSLQEQPGTAGFWHSGDGPPVTELSNQIDADSAGNINQLGDIKGEATDKDLISFESHSGYPSIAAEGKDSLIRNLDYPEESKDGWKFGLPGGGEVINDRS